MKRWMITLILPLLLAGCFSSKRAFDFFGSFFFVRLASNPISLHSLATEDTIIFDETLVGKWAIDENDAYMVLFSITQRSEKGYTIRVFNIYYDAYLVKIGDAKFLDVVYSHTCSPQSLYQQIGLFHHAPLHGFTKISISGDNLLVYPIFHEVLIDSKFADPNKIEYTTLPSRGKHIPELTIITSYTEQLQEYFNEFGENFSFSEDLLLIPLVRMETLYTESNIVFDEDLLGEWTIDEKKFVFERYNKNMYKVIGYDDDLLEGHFYFYIIKFDDVRLMAFFTGLDEHQYCNESKVDLIPDMVFAFEVLDDEIRLTQIETRQEFIDIVNPQSDNADS